MTTRLPITAAAAAAGALLLGLVVVPPASSAVPAPSAAPSSANDSAKPDCSYTAANRDVTTGTAPGAAQTWVTVKVHYMQDNPEKPGQAGTCYGLVDYDKVFVASKWTMVADVNRARDGRGSYLPVPDAKSVQMDVSYTFTVDTRQEVAGVTTNEWGLSFGVAASGPSAGVSWGQSRYIYDRPARPTYTFRGNARNQSKCAVALSPNKAKLHVTCTGSLPRTSAIYTAPSNTVDGTGIRSITVTARMVVAQGPRRSSTATDAVTVRGAACSRWDAHVGRCMS